MNRQRCHGLAIIDEYSLCRRAADGVWSTIATAELDLALM
jgi:hypothetical protein